MSDDTPIWLFDSVCVLCEVSVQYALRHENGDTIRFVSIQSDMGREIADDHGIDPDNPATFLFVENGRALAKSDGVLALARHLNGPARLLLAGRIVPKALRDFAYDLVARNRYRLFGRRAKCILPSPETRHRFVLPDTSE